MPSPAATRARGSALSWWNHGGVASAVVDRALAAASQRPYSGGASCVPVALVRAAQAPW